VRFGTIGIQRHRQAFITLPRALLPVGPALQIGEVKHLKPPVKGLIIGGIYQYDFHCSTLPLIAATRLGHAQ
jgi:hypothetical protein